MTSQPSLEELIKRMQEIYTLIEQRKVTLTESIPLIEELYDLKKKVDTILSDIESKLVTLSDEGDNV